MPVSGDTHNLAEFLFFSRSLKSVLYTSCSSLCPPLLFYEFSLVRPPARPYFSPSLLSVAAWPRPLPSYLPPSILPLNPAAALVLPLPPPLPSHSVRPFSPPSLLLLTSLARSHVSPMAAQPPSILSPPLLCLFTLLMRYCSPLLSLLFLSTSFLIQCRSLSRSSFDSSPYPLLICSLFFNSVSSVILIPPPPSAHRHPSTILPLAVLQFPLPTHTFS